MKNRKTSKSYSPEIRARAVRYGAGTWGRARAAVGGITSIRGKIGCNAEHAFCNAHLLRELAVVIKFDDGPWAEAMRKLLLDANYAVRHAKQAGLSALQLQQIRAFEERYWSAVRQGLALHRKLPKIEGSPKARGRQK